MIHAEPRPAAGGPRISVVMATFNAAEHLPACLENIRRQSYPDRELIVIDGGSTDGTLDILRSHCDLIAHWVSEPDRGIYDAWNKALDHVSGQWVLFRGADDLFWDEQALARSARGLAAAGPDQLIAYGRAVYVDEFGNVTNIGGEEWELSRRTFFDFMNLPHPATFHHVEAFRRFGRFDSSFRIAGDWDFLLRVLKCGEALFLPDGIVTRVFGGGMSRRRNVASVREALRARRANAVPGLPLALWRHMARCAASNARHRAAEAVLGPERLRRALMRRRAARAAALARRITAHFPGSPA